MDMDNAVDTIKEMVSQLKKLNEIAYNQYEPIASDLCSRIAPLDEVEYTLDRMLDFCGDDAVLGLFKAVCRHYFNIYPEMISYQVNSYRETWDTE
ncbi:MAG: hypothetical protein K2K46_02330 [Lachnospiraceae bacterium]|nr:hypothetical protein [Lachnospiraceae bacterium]